MRQHIEGRLGITDRRINFPMYHMKLNKEQYNKLFHGKPFSKVKNKKTVSNRNVRAKSKMGSGPMSYNSK